MGTVRGDLRVGLVVMVVVASLATFTACGRGDEQDVVTGVLAGAADLVAPGDDYTTAVVGETTFLLNRTRAHLSRLGGDEDRVTVEVGRGGPLHLLRSEEALAVLDGRAGLVEWLDPENLTRRQVELDEGDWHGLLAGEELAVLVDRGAGQLVKADRRAVLAGVAVGGRGDELELTLVDEGVLVRNLSEHHESLRRLSDLSEIRGGPLPGGERDRLLNGQGTKTPANWLFNATTGVLHGLGVDGGWAGQVWLTDPGTDARAPMAVGNWVYVLLPEPGTIIVVRAGDGTVEGRVALGRRPDLVLTPDGPAVTVASVPTGYTARLLGTDLEVIGGARTGKSSGRGTSGGAAAGTNRPPGTGKPADQGGGPGTSGPGTVPPVTPPPGTGPGTDGDLGPAEPPGPGPHGYVLTTVRADAIVTTSADVSWELDDPAGRVRQVSVSWSTGGALVDRAVLGPQARAHHLAGLVPGTAYVVEVVAEGHDGSTEAGPLLSMTTLVPPTPVPYGESAAAVSSTTVDVSWSLDDPDGAVTAITVAWAADGEGGQAQLAPTARAHRFEGLDPDTAHEIVVVVTGQDGTTTKGTTLHVATPPRSGPSYSTPAPYLVAAGSTHLDVGWVLADPDGQVSEVAVEVRQGGELVGRAVLDGAARSHRVDGLAPASTYDVVVVVADRFGGTTSSDVLRGTTTA